MDGGKARIKLKLMQNCKERPGMGLPNWNLYYQAVVLNWLKERINMKNQRLIKLEGYNLQLGWHAFLIYEKA